MWLLIVEAPGEIESQVGIRMDTLKETVMLEHFRLSALLPARHQLWTVGGLLGLNLACNVFANTSFKFSAMATTWKSFLAWQVVGNLAGFLTVLTLTGLLKYLPLSVAYPTTMGLAILGVQVIAARWIFHESMVPAQWIGVLLIVIGLWLIQR